MDLKQTVVDPLETILPLKKDNLKFFYLFIAGLVKVRTLNSMHQKRFQFTSHKKSQKLWGNASEMTVIRTKSRWIHSGWFVKLVLQTEKKMYQNQGKMYQNKGKIE